MRTRLRSKATLLFLTLAVLIAVPVVAAIAADLLTDELTGNNLNQNTVSTTQNDPAGYVNTYYLVPKNSGVNVNGDCDVDATHPATFSINTPTGVTATPNTLTFTACGTLTTNSQDVKFTSDTPNATGYTITATQTSGPTGGDTIGTGDADFRLVVNPDTTKPTVTAVTPTGQSESVNTTVTATFSEAMKASTINGTTFTLKNTDANSSIQANVGYNAGTKTATLTPQNPLADSTNYEARVTTGAQDLAGNGLLQDRTWSFKTAAPACTNPSDPTFSGSPNGANGWYTSVPTVSATSSTSGATVKYSDAQNGTYSTTAPTLGQGTTTVWAKAFSSTGSCSSAAVSQTYKVDSVPPSITDGGAWTQALPGQATSPNGAGWYASEVFNKFTATDATSGLVGQTSPYTFTKGSGTAEGTAVKINSGVISDQAGNTNSLDSVGYKIDLTRPDTTLAATGPSGWINDTANQTFSWSGSDNLTANADLKYAYKLDSGSYSAPTSNTSVSLAALVGSGTLSQGEHTFTVKAIDLAGNDDSVNPATRTFSFDNVAPQFQCDPIDTLWHANNVTLHCTASDGASGLANGSPASFDLSTSVAAGNETDNASTNSQPLSDIAGNSVTAGPYSPIKVDRKAPNTSADTGTYNGGWTNQDVTVTLNANDGGSGVKKTEYSIDGGNFQAYPNGGIIVSNDGDHTILYRSTDNVDNQEQNQSLTVKVDKTNPTISASVLNQPDANTNWYNISTGGPQVHFDCTDALSGIQSCPPDHTITDEGPNVGHSGTAFDVAGNDASAGVSNLKNDQTAPDVAGAPDLLATSDSGDPDDDLTNDKTPTFDITAEAGSTVKLYAKKNGVETLIGQAPATSGVATITSNQDLADGTYDVYAHVTDQAGNVSDTNVLNITIVSIDATAPADPGLTMDAASDTGVSNSDKKTNNDKPTFNGTAEAGSTLKLYDGTNLLTTITVGTGGTWSFTPTTALSEGTHTLKATATDAANNTSNESQLSDVVIDKTNPTISATLTPATSAPSGWYNISTGAPKASYTCGDTLSGLNGACPGVFTFGEGSNLSHSETISDQAGNEATATVSDIKVDLSKPTNIAFQGILAQTYPVANVPAQSAISCTATDVISPPATCVVDFTNYSNALGSHTLTATATDKAGNTNTATLTYIVGLQAGEVLSPVDSTGKANPLATNLDNFKIKSTVPVKFKLYNDTAKTQLMTSPPAGSVAKISFFQYDKTSETNQPLEALPTGSANTDNIFRWSGSPDNQYIYNLGTSTKNTAGTYGVQLTLYASDGTTKLAESAKYYFVLRT